MPLPWRFTPLDPTRVRRLSDALSIGPLTAQVLIARGLDEPATAKAFLTPSPHDLHDPDLLPGVAEAADRVVAAVKADRRVTIFGDYDVDGITSTALLVDCLRLAGARADYVIPNRGDGYGLNVAAIERLHAEDADRLVITVDCGVTAVAEAERAAALGLELIVTDHHTPGDRLPPAAVVVHPRRPDAPGAYPFGELCGAGVAFKLAWAVAKRLGGREPGQRAIPRLADPGAGSHGPRHVGGHGPADRREPHLRPLRPAEPVPQRPAGPAGAAGGSAGSRRAGR